MSGDHLDLSKMRTQYEPTPLRRASLAATWEEQFAAWLADAQRAGVPEPNAMVLATAGDGCQPSTRTVLLKAVEEGELVFYTNYSSRKGRELAQNPCCSVTFPWIGLGRQVTITGRARRGTDEEADAYFATRPHGSQIGALASEQSEPIGSREQLERRAAELAAAHHEGQAVPRPHNWGGYRVAPATIEFWQGRPDRLHDRLRFSRAADGGWIVERLSP